MAFSDYKNISQVQKEFEITYQEQNFIVAPRVEPPAHFREEFDFNQKNIDVLTSCKKLRICPPTPVETMVYGLKLWFHSNLLAGG